MQQAAPRPYLHKDKGQTGEGAKLPAACEAAGTGAAGNVSGRSQAEDGDTPPLKARAAQQHCSHPLNAANGVER